jgi:membrane protease subunit HflK
MYRAVIAIAIIIVVAVIGYQGIYTVTEQQNAVVTTFGAYNRNDGLKESGIHFKIPFIQQVHLVDTTIRGMEFGYSSASGQYRQNEHESLMITANFNFVNIDFYVQWQVVDPVKFLFASEDPELLLRNILQAEARSVVSQHQVDEVLTTQKIKIQLEILANVRERLDNLVEHNIGIYVHSVAIQDAAPPTEEVTAAFRNVENARQQFNTIENEANTYEQKILNAAKALADFIEREAEAEYASRVNDARGQADRFDAMYEQYILQPDITMTRMFLETMEDVLPGVSLFVDGGGDLLRFLDITPPAGNTDRNTERDGDN